MMRAPLSVSSGSPDPAGYRALVRPGDARHIEIIDQRALPHRVVTTKIADADPAAHTVWRSLSIAILPPLRSRARTPGSTPRGPPLSICAGHSIAYGAPSE